MIKSVYVNNNDVSVNKSVSRHARSGKPAGLCFKCGNPGHIRAHCPAGGKKKRGRKFPKPVGATPPAEGSSINDDTVVIFDDADPNPSVGEDRGQISPGPKDPEPSAPPPDTSLGLIAARKERKWEHSHFPKVGLLSCHVPELLQLSDRKELVEWYKERKKREKDCVCAEMGLAASMRRRAEAAEALVESLARAEEARSLDDANRKHMVTPPPLPSDEWWKKKEYSGMVSGLEGWVFSFHDFPAVFRESQARWAQALALLPFLAALAIMLVWYPSLWTLWAVVLTICMSMVITEVPLHPGILFKILRQTANSTRDSLIDSWNTGMRAHANRYILGRQSRQRNVTFLSVGVISLILLTIFVGLIGWVVSEYLSVLYAFAELMLSWETKLYHYILPSDVWEYWNMIPLHVRHLICWLSWSKYLLATWFAARFYGRYILLSTSVTTVYFIEFLPEVQGADKRQHTFRNQDLCDSACPIKLGFTRRVFGLIPIMSQERVSSATMIMELTAHKFLNGTVDLPDTVDRINRAMKGIGYLDIDATDVFRNQDQAEIARIVAISWAKHKLEVNYGLRLQDF